MNTLELFYKYTSKETDKEVSLENFVRIFLFLVAAFKENFYSEFEDKVYSIYADIVSFTDNPQCSCKIKIANYIEEHHSEMYLLVEEWFKNYKELNSYTPEYDKVLLEMFNQITERNAKNTESKGFRGEPETPNSKYMFGKIVTISDTAEEFNKLFRFLKDNDYHYNHISVVKQEDNKIKIYFA
jgi:hypothetical protein